MTREELERIDRVRGNEDRNSFVRRWMAGVCAQLEAERVALALETPQ